MEATIGPEYSSMDSLEGPPRVVHVTSLLTQAALATNLLLDAIQTVKAFCGMSPGYLQNHPSPKGLACPKHAGR